MAEGRPSMLVVLLLLALDLVAFGLAVAAERRRSTGRVVPDMYDEATFCVYNSDIATGYGGGAFIFLLVSQVLLMGITRCLCCGSTLRPGGSRASAVVLFGISWLTFLVAEACFIAGAARNAYHTKYRGKFGMGDLTCATLRKGVFAAGAGFTVITLILSELYYVSFCKARGGWTRPYASEPQVGMSSYAK